MMPGSISPSRDGKDRLIDPKPNTLSGLLSHWRVWCRNEYQAHVFDRVQCSVIQPSSAKLGMHLHEQLITEGSNCSQHISLLRKHLSRVCGFDCFLPGFWEHLYRRVRPMLGAGGGVGGFDIF